MAKKPNLDRLIKFVNIIKGGQIFSVRFTKRTTGEERLMVARLGVTKGVNGTGYKFNPTSKGLVTVFDMQNRGFRFVSVEGIKEVRAHGQTFQF